MHLNGDIASGRPGATSYRADFRLERIDLPNWRVYPELEGSSERRKFRGVGLLQSDHNSVFEFRLIGPPEAGAPKI